MTGARGIVAIALWIVAASGPAAAEPAIEFRVAGEPVARWTAPELERRLGAEDIRFFHPFYNREKRYRAVPVAALLDRAFGSRWRDRRWSDAVFIALDGYEAAGNIERLKERGGWLAFRDLDLDGGWEPVGYRRADPGPFFLVWTGPEQTTEHAYPWPWQVAAVNLVRFEDQYPAVIPAGAEPGSAPDRGFTIFRERCLRCHAIDRQGGKIGPDLNAPQSITVYRPEQMIKAFIRKPSDYRHTHMPDHTDLTDRDLDDLYRYLRFKAGK